MEKEKTLNFKLSNAGESKASMLRSPKRDFKSIERDQEKLQKIKEEIRIKNVTPSLKSLNLGKLTT